MLPESILFEDDALIAVNKPCGYFVHRSALDRDSSEILLPLIRNYLGKRAYPVHRLDRKTSGVLLMAKNKEAQANLNAQFRDRTVKKQYRAIVRGFLPGEGEIDYALTNDRNQLQEALTLFKCLQRVELPFQTSSFPTSRYSYIQLQPITGRQHQIRKHLAHVFHPILGDRPHGCNKQNRYFLQHYNLQTIMLHATSLHFIHPFDHIPIHVEAPFPLEMKRIAKILGIDLNAVIA